MADHGVAKMPALHPSPGTILVHAKADGAQIICGVAASRRCLGRVCSGCGHVPFSHVASKHWHMCGNASPGLRVNMMAPERGVLLTS